MDEEDKVPLISPQFQHNGSPKVSAFYDELENSRGHPDEEPSMDLGSMSNVVNQRNIDSAQSKVYNTPNVEDSSATVEKYITCQICQTTISLKSFRARVVKCPRCQEGNPIKEPPPGKKYIRCACNCLLVCNATARAVICPREGCHHRTQLINPPPKPQFAKEEKGPSVTCPACYCTVQLTDPKAQYFPCMRCSVRITSLSHSERSLLMLRYVGFFIILALLLTTGILILELVPGKIWEPMLFCGLAFGVGFPCLICKFIPLCKSKPYR